MKIAKPYPYLYRDTDRQGHVRWRFRAPARKTLTIKGEFGSSEFAANYRAAFEGQKTESIVASAKYGTMADLARSYLRSATFANLASATRKSRRYWIESFIARHGTLPVTRLERRHVKMILDSFRARPGAARNVLSMLRVLITEAIDLGIVSEDPTAGIRRPKLNEAGWHTWTEKEIAQYEAQHPIGSQARLGFALALHTGQRSSDLIEIGRQHVSGDKISVRQHKTGRLLNIPISPELKAIIDATPSKHLTFIVTEHGKPYAHSGSFGNRMRRWAAEANLKGCPLHGLRKACCRRLAEVGCTASEIMAISGHKSLAECERYVRDAEQAKMADRAIARTTSYPHGDRSYPQEKKA